MIGMTTTCRVLSRRSPVGTSTRVPASQVVRIGVMRTASNVDPAVIVTERVTSARARNEITFDAVPPGQHDTRMIPTARGDGRANTVARPHPNAGISVYWSRIPGSTRWRSREIRRKSSRPTVMPMQSMMVAKPNGIRGPLNQVRNSGRTSAIALAARTQIGKAFVSVAITLLSREIVYGRRKNGVST